MNNNMKQSISSHKFVDEREHSYVITNKYGEIDSKPKTDYFKLKLIDFDDNRIFYIFKEKYNGKHIVKVEETYTDGIFNCYVGTALQQISDAETIAKTILNEDLDEFIATFKLWQNSYIQKHIIRTMIQELSILSRIQIKDDGDIYIIDDMFLVNKRGNAYSLKNKEWSPLCIVANGQHTITDNNSTTDIIVSNSDKTSHEKMNRITQIILAKILFLLYPNPDDSVFMGQLSPSVKKHVQYSYHNRTN